MTKGGEITIQQAQDLSQWAIDRTRSQIGSGREAYKQATETLLHWQHFDFDWAFTNAPAVKIDAPVVVIAKSLFLWSMNPLRITSIEKDGPPSNSHQNKLIRRRSAFAHTTVATHQISGEERFAVEWNKNDDSVWFEILSVSKPATPLALIAQPLLRFYQRRFVAQSMHGMKRQCSKH